MWFSLTTLDLKMQSKYNRAHKVQGALLKRNKCGLLLEEVSLNKEPLRLLIFIGHFRFFGFHFLLVALFFIHCLYSHRKVSNENVYHVFICDSDQSISRCTMRAVIQRVKEASVTGESQPR